MSLLLATKSYFRRKKNWKIHLKILQKRNGSCGSHPFWSWSFPICFLRILICWPWWPLWSVSLLWFLPRKAMYGHRSWWSCSVSYMVSSRTDSGIGVKWSLISAWLCRWHMVHPHVDPPSFLGQWHRTHCTVDAGLSGESGIYSRCGELHHFLF